MAPLRSAGGAHAGATARRRCPISIPDLAAQPAPRWRRALGWLGRALRRAPPTGDELRWFFLGSVLPLLPLVAFRLMLRRGPVTPWTAYDLKMLLFGEAQQWLLAGGVALLVGRSLGRWTPRAFKALWVGFTVVLCAACAADIAFFQTTGGRVDWELIFYAARDIERAWPVAASEMSPARWGMVVGLVGICLVPALLPSPKRGRWPLTALWVVLLLLCTDLITPPKGRYTRLSRDLRDALLVTLALDASDRWYDRPIPAKLDELQPLTVRVHAAAEGRRPPNIVVVVLESVGALNTTPYDPLRRTTPNLDRLAQNGLMVDTMYTVLPHTTKALISTLCGTYPYPATQVVEARPDGMWSPCLPTLLREAGYRSAFFQTARGDFEDRVGLTHNMGFDRFLPSKAIPTAGWDGNNYFGVDDRAMIAPSMQWVEQERADPFFAVYLTLSSHHEYKVPNHWPQRSYPGVSGARGRYLAAVGYVDDVLGRIVDEYEKAGLMDNTVFLIIGDHGEGFGEHGRWQHDLVIFEEGLRVPAVLYGPAVLGRSGVIHGNRQQIDVLPTILDLAGLEPTGGVMVGESLFRDVAPDRRLFHTCFRPGNCSADRVGDEKFIDMFRYGPPRLHDVRADPLERKNLLRGQPLTDEIAAREVALDTWRREIIGRYEAAPARIAADRSREPREAAAVWRGGEAELSMISCAPWAERATPGEVAFLRCTWRLESSAVLRLRPEVRLRQGSVTTPVASPGSVYEPPVWRWAPGELVDFDLRVPMPLRLKEGPVRVEVRWLGPGGAPMRSTNAEDGWEAAGGLSVRRATNAKAPKPLPPPAPEAEEREGGGEGGDQDESDD